MEDIKINVTVSPVNFWSALEIYYKHPNSINKQVLFQEDVFSVDLQSSKNQFECRLLYEKFHNELSKGFSLQANHISNNSGFALIQPEFINEVFTRRIGMYLLIRRLVPKLYKNDNVKFYEFIFLDKNSMNVYIFTGSTISVDYSNTIESERQDPFVILKFDFIQLIWDSHSVKFSYDKNLNEKGRNWVKVIFATKFTRLLVNDRITQKSHKSFNKVKFENQVDVVEYYKLYEKLKNKYAKTLIENWTETTDPKKFVYEDIGIATYLILLWNRGRISENETKAQKFIDLGCGNGLLVHILNSEGHCGVGLDVRKRKIWDTYPSTTFLKEETIIPAIETTYPEADWLIGNHSDELTAWLPIMARLSNPLCQYFALPCCPYQLNGKKFQRKNSGCSSYQDFMYYVRKISEICHFETYIDKLRIPSTKRICIIGFNHGGASPEQYALIRKEIIHFVVQENQTHLGCNNSGKNTFALDFRLRESTEPVRNCTKVPYVVREEILKTVMHELLKENVLCDVTRGEQNYVWNRGGKISISSLAASINEDLLKQLKNECKGLQTLLKNHHFLFEVGQGFVQFRSPDSMLKICQKAQSGPEESKWKRKNCWLFSNHPDGCPLSNDTCSYSHVK